jgi:rubrerythrin
MNEHIELLLEKISAEIPDSVQKKLSSQTVRKEMLAKFGRSAFLLPEELKFPIVDPSTGKPNIRLIYAAYVRARQWSDKKPAYKKVAERAKALFIANGGPEKLNIHIEESLTDILNQLGFGDLLNILPTENRRPGVTTYLEPNPVCYCPNCGFTCALGGYQSCDEQPCPICDTYMCSADDEGVTDENISDVIGNLVSETITTLDGEESDKFMCSNCKTVVGYEVRHKLLKDGKCPICENNMMIMFEQDESINNSMRRYCPNCKSTFEYHGRKDPIDCPICETLTVITSPINPKK